MNYKAYPKSKDTPSRKSRKGGRHAVYNHNKYALRKLRNEARKSRREATMQEYEGQESDNEGVAS